MSNNNPTQPIHNDSDPRWAELADWIENQPIGVFRDTGLPDIERMTPVERAAWFEKVTPYVPFSTPCPDWCTVAARGLRHEDDILKATGASCTSHTDDGFDLGRRDHVCLVQEDTQVPGEPVNSRTFVLLMGSDRDELTIADLLARADALRLAAGKYTPILEAAK